MNILPIAIERTLGETTYSVASGQMYVACIAAGFALALLVALLVMARRRTGAIVAPHVAALAIPFVGIYVFIYGTRSLGWSRGEEHHSTVLFRDLVIVDAVAAGVGIGAAVAAILVLALRTDGQLRLMKLALPCAMLGTLAYSGVRHADAIVRVGSLPFFGVDGERRMHVGHERDVRVQLMRPARRRFWSGMEDGPRPADDYVRDGWSHSPRVHVRATSAGPVPFAAVATRGPVTLTTKLAVHALPETASPLLSLRVGDEAVYRVRARSSRGAVLYFIPLAGGEHVGELTVGVVATREREGLRTFVVEIARDGRSHEVELVALNGETRRYDVETGKVGEAVASFADAAPGVFETRRSSTVGGVVTGLVAVLTIGLVILPDGSTTTSFALVSTHRGAEGAPEALPGEHRATLDLP